MAVVRSVGGAILGLSKRAALTTALVARYGGRGRREVRGALRHDERERQVPEARGQTSCPVLPNTYGLRRTATSTAKLTWGGDCCCLVSGFSEPEARPALQEAGGCIDLRPYLIRDGAHGPARLRTRKYCEFHERLRAAWLANQSIRSLLRSFVLSAVRRERMLCSVQSARRCAGASAV
jgi:hypothetical protein